MTPRAHGLGLNVVAHDPYADRDWAAKNNVKLLSFDELLAAADIVSLHMPCTKETTDLINRDSIAKMKKDAVLVNTSRGGLVDEQALFEALESKRLFGAALDVLKVEPPAKDHPLFKLKNVTFAPHMGGIDQTALDAMAELAAQCVVDLSRGTPRPGCVVNTKVLEGWKW
jgi:D-3-phosphoglycerate dehydrogenase / 2-oxoglutarate reductase